MAQEEVSWEHFPHGADIGIRGFGATPAAAFAEAARAMTAVVADPGLVEPRLTIHIACEASNLETLLFDWLNRLVLEMALRKMLFSKFELVIKGGTLNATVQGEPVDVARHEPAAEVKGATFTEMRVARAENGRWIAQCVLDV